MVYSDVTLTLVLDHPFSTFQMNQTDGDMEIYRLSYCENRAYGE